MHESDGLQIADIIGSQTEAQCDHFDRLAPPPDTEAETQEEFFVRRETREGVVGLFD